MFFIILIPLLLQAILIFGMLFAYAQREFYIIAEEHYVGDFLAATFFAVVTALLPVLGLVLIYFLTRGAKHGLKFK